MAQAKTGDVVKLAKGEGILVDYETGFEVFGDQEKPLGEKIGSRTRMAIQSGGLLIVSAKKEKSSKAADKTKTEETK